MHLPKAPEAGRGALMFPVEGGRWMVALAGRDGDFPPGDEAGFRAFTEGLRTSTLTTALRSARMLDRVERYRFPESRLRHFERLGAFPRGLLPLGDAICRFNPIFGQGMSVAALEARALGEALAGADPGDGLAAARRRFFDRVVEIVDTPWALAAVPDLVYPRTVGVRPPEFEMSLRFGVALTRATSLHADIHKVAAEVQQLLRPRAALTAPGIVERVMAAMG
jgi:2-polyprenyl-6-methoxyphenol hydroxylase-like FAD-dependent oxidoreductase